MSLLFVLSLSFLSLQSEGYVQRINIPKWDSNSVKRYNNRRELSSFSISSLSKQQQNVHDRCTIFNKFPLYAASSSTNNDKNVILENEEDTIEEQENEIPEDTIQTPASFYECIQQAQEATLKAMEKGYKLMEVDFPPLSAAEMADSASSGQQILGANLELVLDYSKRFSREGYNVAIMVPDTEELEISQEYLGGTLNPYTNVTFRSCRPSRAEAAESVFDLITGIFSRAGGKVNPAYTADMYIFITISCQELPDVEKIHELDPDKPKVLFNLNLETLRGDLGMPAFPSKDLHYRFLTQILPVYYLRARQYSQTLAKPPFLLNYQGALFRVYPGGYQNLLDTGNGRYRRVSVSRDRPALGEFKDIITNALNVDTGNDNQGLLGKMRKGVSSRTWWEKEEDFDKEGSKTWRS